MQISNTHTQISISIWFLKYFKKRPGETSQVKMLNLNLVIVQYKNKSHTYYMNFKHKNMSYMPL